MITGRAIFFALRSAVFLANFRGALAFFAFGFGQVTRLALAGFFGEGLALRRACFLE
jgi:hypothetical protein